MSEKSGPGGTRTHGFLSAIEARSQLRYRPVYTISSILSDGILAVKKPDMGEKEQSAQNGETRIFTLSSHPADILVRTVIHGHKPLDQTEFQHLAGGRIPVDFQEY